MGFVVSYPSQKTRRTGTSQPAARGTITIFTHRFICAMGIHSRNVGVKVALGGADG